MTAPDGLLPARSKLIQVNPFSIQPDPFDPWHWQTGEQLTQGLSL
jgi:hypothetical protein